MGSRLFVRGLKTSSRALAADAPALATKGPADAGLLSSLGFGSTRIDTPLNVGAQLSVFEFFFTPPRRWW
jgi:hypothetical protein